MKTGFPLLALGMFIGLTCVGWSPEQAGIHLTDPEVVNHHGTVVRPVLDERLPRGKNVLWCATFQMAWDSASRHFGGPLRLQPASQLADSLNGSPFNARWIDAESVFHAGGTVGDGVLDRIDQGARAKGHHSKLLDRLRKTSKAEDLVFHALLVKDLEFEKPFARLGKWKLGGRTVPWFGFTPEQRDTGGLLQQIGVHHYAARNDFVIELRSKQTGDQLLLAKLPAAPATPAAACLAVLKRLRADPPRAGGADLLAVPNIVADEKASFAELEGRTVSGSGRLVRAAMQTIDFRMDEKGVKLRSEAAISFGCSAHHRVEPRLLILDPPFAIVMKRQDAPRPYFVAWIANADLLGGK
ncbi:MAG: hypothetical protein MUF86_00055 [Akkermansiaceae bacterium]|nr:hypothetical protein [Akkermansiaceae bacterium]